MRATPIASLLACLLAGCVRSPEPESPAGAPVDDAGAMPGPVAALPASRFGCEGGHRVELIPGFARVTLADGRLVDVPADGAAYRGEALSFIPAGDHATLAQDEVGAFPCRRAD